MITPEQIESRRNFIGGSDCPIILGLSPWKTRAQLWEQKVHGADPIDLDNQRLWIGNMVEGSILSMFADKTGLNVKTDDTTFVSEFHPFMAGHVDGFVVEDGTNTAIVEAKFTNPWSFKKGWGSGPPLMYVAQVQHLMHVTEMTTSWICVLVGNESFHYYEVPRNQSLIDKIIQKEERFWELVTEKVPPYEWQEYGP